MNQREESTNLNQRLRVVEDSTYHSLYAKHIYQ